MIYLAAILLMILLPALLLFGLACNLAGRLFAAIMTRLIPKPPRRP